MQQKLDSYLVEKYPKIFINRHKGPMNSCMFFGFDHNDGWFWILDQLCNSIQGYIDMNNKWNTDKISQVVADQVKEKYGILNFYCHGGNDQIDGMISLAETMSSNTCEFCGSTENVGKTNGWIYTICKDCYDHSNERISYLSWCKNENSPNEDVIKEIRKIKLDKLNLK